MADSTHALDITVGKRKSFYSLFANDGYTIKIPKLQRDYAQGRSSSKEIRDAFLDALHTYLEEGLPCRDLDFVYGSLAEGKQKCPFIPLDGQQRLTTLFLLHWYLAWISGDTDHFKAALLEDGKMSRFTYETRPSSSEFCDALLTRVPSCEALVAGGEISQLIKKLSWFRLSWQSDPTVVSMLNMLDAIHEKFQGKGEYYKRLVDPDKPVITFFLLDLKDSRLTDDLYIKMNARGKPLTPFEVFKAKLERNISALDWEEDGAYIFTDAGGKKLSPLEYFSLKIDTAWADLFWQYRDMKSNVFDAEMMNFIRVMFTFQYLSSYGSIKNATEKNLAEKAREHLLDTYVARKDNDYQPILTYRQFEMFNAISAKGVSLLIAALDALENGTEKIKRHISPEFAFYYDEEIAMLGILKAVPSHQDRVLFYAYIAFLIQRCGDSAGLDEWMRVMHNMIKNSNIDGSDEVTRAIKSIDSLLQHCDSILEFLAKSAPESIDFFYSGQTLEEIIKARLILLPDAKGAAWGKAIREAEKNKYFAGQTGFLLGFCGLIQAFENGTLEQVEQSTLQLFVTYTQKVNAVFPRPENDALFAWERAVLSKGNYPLWASSWRRNFLSKPGAKARDYSWKRFFRLPAIRDKDTDKSFWVTQRSYAQNVFDDPLFDAAQAEQSLEKLCIPSQGNWRDNLIQNPALISYCEQGFFQQPFDNDEMEHIYLYKHSRISHTHAELFSYDFFLSELENKSFLPFVDIWYYYATSEDDSPCAVLSGWQMKNQKFELDIYGLLDKNYAESFSLDFIPANGPRKLKNYPDALQHSLTAISFKWNDEEEAFCRSDLSRANVTKAIAKLCKSLKSINV